MKDTAQKCTRWLRKAQEELRGARLTVDEVTSLLLVERQLQTDIMVAGADARAQLIADEEDAEAMGFKKHLKSVPAEEAPDA